MRVPTAGAVGYPLSPLRGWAWHFGRRKFQGARGGGFDATLSELVV